MAREIPSSLNDLPATTAVVEYIETFPERKYHGNAKRKDANQKYIRTKPKVNKKLRSLLAQEPVKNVERKVNREVVDDHDRQRNEKQLRNLKHSINREKNSVSGTNAAENIIKVKEMTKNHPFVNLLNI